MRVLGSAMPVPRPAVTTLAPSFGPRRRRRRTEGRIGPPSSPGARQPDPAYRAQPDPACRARPSSSQRRGPHRRHTWSVPMRSLVSERAEPERLRRLSARLEASADSARALPVRREVARTAPDDLLRRLRDGLVWGEATVVADRPDKPETERPVLLEGLRA